jgi:cephalosporin-C deacetylase-like acetyl esterase
MKKLLAALLLLIAYGIQASAQGEQESYEKLLKRFDYDKSAPLDLRETGVVERDGVKIHDLSYQSLHGGRVPAYLVVPKGGGKFAGIIFGHWAMKDSPTRNRTEFLEEAVALAQAGAVSLLIDAPLTRPGFKPATQPFDPQDVKDYFQQVMDMRRAVDLLLARKDIDPKRIAYVGHSYNANVGGLLSGVEKRIKTFVLMAGSLADVEALRSDDPNIVKLRKMVGEEKIEQIIKETGWLDPANYIGHAAPSSVLLQYAYKDGYLTEARARHYFEMVSEPKALKLYDTDHALNAAARLDRYEWLRERIKLRKLDRAVLDKVPQVK